MTEIRLLQGDITKLKADAIVNAANQTLMGGGGVDGAIHRAAGPELLEECRKLGGCETGQAKITKGYRLPAKFVIHTVGPIYSEKKSDAAQLLADCYWNCLTLAKQKGLKSIAFPAISTGAYRFPKDKAARIAIATVERFIHQFPQCLDEVVFVLFTAKDLEIYQKLNGTAR
jgi:O-acetyl-ADP-ribose deacetylase